MINNTLIFWEGDLAETFSFRGSPPQRTVILHLPPRRLPPPHLRLHHLLPLRHLRLNPFFFFQSCLLLPKRSSTMDLVLPFRPHSFPRVSMLLCTYCSMPRDSASICRTRADSVHIANHRHLSSSCSRSSTSRMPYPLITYLLTQM